MHRKGSVSVEIFASYRKLKLKKKLARKKKKKKKTGKEVTDSQNWSLEVGLASSIIASTLRNFLGSSLLSVSLLHLGRLLPCWQITTTGVTWDHEVQKFLFHKPQWKSPCISLAGLSHKHMHRSAKLHAVTNQSSALEQRLSHSL